MLMSAITAKATNNQNHHARSTLPPPIKGGSASFVG